MQQHEVTNDEYRRFDPTYKFDSSRGKYPVTHVKWYVAAAYAAWLGASLPSDAEWSYAAFGASHRQFPWGNEPLTPARAVYQNDKEGLQPVGLRPNGRTPEEQVEDLLGNAAEWCRDEDPRSSSNDRIIRGGSFQSSGDELLKVATDSPTTEAVDVGFRLVSHRSPK
jgi:formylglycine-generating enzyme required for sulfatase activity